MWMKNEIPLTINLPQLLALLIHRRQKLHLGRDKSLQYWDVAVQRELQFSLFVFPEKRMNEDLINGATVGSAYAMSE